MYTKKVQPFQGWLEKTRSDPQVSSTPAHFQPGAIHVQSFQDWQIVPVPEPHRGFRKVPFAGMTRGTKRTKSANGDTVSG